MARGTKTSVLVALVVATLLGSVFADTYMHNPRGSNNRLNERSANRANGNRMFDSQNNNRGGYNKGDVDTSAAPAAPEALVKDQHLHQYDMMYYMSANPSDPAVPAGGGKSIMTIEWMNQHGCGGNEHNDPHKLNCEIVLQYMCVPTAFEGGKALHVDRRTNCNGECFMPHPQNPDCTKRYPACALRRWVDEPLCEKINGLWRPALLDDEFNCPHKCSIEGHSNMTSCNAAGGTWTEPNRQTGSGAADFMPLLRDGTTTNRQEFTRPNNRQETQAQRFDRKKGNVRSDRGLHEPWEWYDECDRRERNRGLFTADQNLRNNNLGYSSAVYTRQNPNNNRRGYECPEERDHYPYWHPSPWVDIAIMTDRLDMCPFYRSESQNVKGKHLCRNTATCRNCVRYNRKATCEANGGRWVEAPPHNVDPPACLQAPWNRVNHNGNGRWGQHNSFNWTLPFLGEREHKCVVRLRYNISTDDYDGNLVNASFNNNNGQGIKSPVKQNPNVDIGAVNTALRLAINTAQFGRTFQDRSHVFTLAPRSGTFWNNNYGRTLYNINVRGKRGNIVQTYPAVEYDFIPNQLHVSESDLVHFQWTGSNTHNNGNPAGDGQAGDAGEGTRGTDRHNVVELSSRNFKHSFPQTWEENTMWNGLLDAYAPVHGAHQSSDHYDPKANKGASDAWKVDWAVRMATAGFYKEVKELNAAPGSNTPFPTERMVKSLKPDGSTRGDTKVNELLNNAPASFEGGVFRFRRGTYNFMCTRNHNFSNRDQKATLLVE